MDKYVIQVQFWCHSSVIKLKAFHLFSLKSLRFDVSDFLMQRRYSFHEDAKKKKKHAKAYSTTSIFDDFKDFKKPDTYL